MRVVERPGGAHVEVDGERMLLYVPARTSVDRRCELPDRWYREQLRRAIPELVAKWEPVLAVTVRRWSIRRM
ncbi:MAG: YgjP-like metallopeptidase domain-containing protein [Natronosporangium sp.]